MTMYIGDGSHAKLQQVSNSKHHWDVIFTYNVFYSNGTSRTNSIKVMSNVKEGHHGRDITNVSIRLGRNASSTVNAQVHINRYKNLALQMEAPNNIQPAPIKGTLQVVQDQLAEANRVNAHAVQTIADLRQRNAVLSNSNEELRANILGLRQIITQLETEQDQDRQLIDELTIQLRAFERQLLDYVLGIGL